MRVRCLTVRLRDYKVALRKAFNGNLSSADFHCRGTPQKGHTSFVRLIRLPQCRHLFRGAHRSTKITTNKTAHTSRIVVAWVSLDKFRSNRQNRYRTRLSPLVQTCYREISGTTVRAALIIWRKGESGVGSCVVKHERPYSGHPLVC